MRVQSKIRLEKITFCKVEEKEGRLEKRCEVEEVGEQTNERKMENKKE